MTDTSEFLERQVAALQGQMNEVNKTIGGLVSSINHLITDWQRNDADATSGRRELHHKVEQGLKETRDSLDAFKNEMHSKVNVMAARVDTMSKELAKVGPSVTAFEHEKLRTEGAKALGAWIWSAIGLAAGVVGFFAHDIFNAIFKSGAPPHP